MTNNITTFNSYVHSTMTTAETNWRRFIIVITILGFFVGFADYSSSITTIWNRVVMGCISAIITNVMFAINPDPDYPRIIRFLIVIVFFRFSIQLFGPTKFNIPGSSE